MFPFLLWRLRPEIKCAALTIYSVSSALSSTLPFSGPEIGKVYPVGVEQHTRPREKMRKAGIKTLIADGESLELASSFGPYLNPRRLTDVRQLDIRTSGLLEHLAAARICEQTGAVSLPHNWGSQVGGLMALQLARVARNVSGAEDDRSTCDVIATEGDEFRNGYYTLPDRPGLSIKVDEAVYRQKCKPVEVVIA